MSNNNVDEAREALLAHTRLRVAGGYGHIMDAADAYAKAQSAADNAALRRAAPYRCVAEFHEAFDIPTRTTPTADIPERDLREALLQEEFDEYLAASKAGDIVELADALADMVVVIYGTALAHGIPLDDVFAEVHRSNMTKLGPDGKPIRRDDGKVMKGPDYERPNIRAALAAAKPEPRGVHRDTATDTRSGQEAAGAV